MTSDGRPEPCIESEPFLEFLGGMPRIEPSSGERGVSLPCKYSLAGSPTHAQPGGSYAPKHLDRIPTPRRTCKELFSIIVRMISPSLEKMIARTDRSSILVSGNSCNIPKKCLKDVQWTTSFVSVPNRCTVCPYSRDTPHPGSPFLSSCTANQFPFLSFGALPLKTAL